MLTKTEINQKKAKSEQLDLIETVSSVDESRKKRQLLFVSIFITIGLSFLFWSYRQFKTFKFELPRLPAISTPTANTIESEITRLISSDPNKWQVSVYQDHDPNFPRLDFKNNSSFTADLLPQGLDVKENYIETSGTITLNSLITTPRKKILFVITIEGNQVAQSKELLSKLITNLYWIAIKD